MANSPAQAANIKELLISSGQSNSSADVSVITPDFRYYESVLSNTTTCSMVLAESGYSMDGNDNIASEGLLDGLPIRGGERVDISIEDNYGNTLTLKDGMYVNRVRNAQPGTQNDVYMLDLCSKDYFANEQTRVVRRYEGKISDNVTKILKEVLKTDTTTFNVDSTAIDYNFIGNDRKPLYVCTWLASKAVPIGTSSGTGNSVGGAAGYLFYQTRDGFNFRSIDKLFEQQSTKNFLYNNVQSAPPGGYDAKILSYNIDRDVDLKESMTLGTYNNRSIFFDMWSMNYKVVNFDIGQQKSKLSTSGKKFAPELVSREFTQSPTRLFSHVLDVGAIPRGTTSDAQLKNWKERPETSNYDAERSMVQSVMRYNQLFSIQTNITIPLDLSIKAGDLITCEFPKLKGESNKESNPESGGIYMVAHVCHRVTPEDSFSSLSLVRDSFGKNTGFTNP
jgi:hypothetical protein|tara:strand:+ start:1403 stop:2749 length:1347 start_codon:yes stop_codon:yes gene_type:complete